MSKPLKLVAANDAFSALMATTQVLAGQSALFITGPEVNGVRPQVHNLPDEVDDSVAFIVESSGSTGSPKRIELSLEAALASAEASAKRLGAAGQWLLALPANYVAGLNVLIRSAVADTQPVMLNTSVSFTAEAFARHASMMTHERRFTSLVPTQIMRLAIAAEQDENVLNAMRSFTAILVGGQALAVELKNDLVSAGVNLVETYGSAETFGGVVYDGVPLEGVTVSIVENSLIEISSPTLANQFRLKQKIVMNDLGEIVDGKLRVLGRADRVINSGAIKISLDLIEATASAVPGVVEVAATAIADESWGERVGLLYVGSPEVADEVASRLANDLGPAAKPLRIIRADRIPKLSNQKYDLLAIRDLFERQQNG